MMVNEATIRKLHEMRLSSMAGAYRDQMSDPSMKDFPFEERLGMMVDTEWAARRNNRLSRLIRNADFPMHGSSIEGVEYHADRKLNREEILQLSTCNYVEEKQTSSSSGHPAPGRRI